MIFICKPVYNKPWPRILHVEGGSLGAPLFGNVSGAFLNIWKIVLKIPGLYHLIELKESNSIYNDFSYLFFSNLLNFF